RVLTVVPLVTVESAPIQHSGYAAPIVAPAPRLNFILAAAERDHDATIIHQRGRSRWCIPVGILPIKPRTPRVANGTESGKPLFVIEAVEHGLPLVHFVRTDARINLTEMAFLFILLQLDVDCFGALTVVHTSKLSLVAALIVQLHLIYHVPTEVACHKRRVVTEKLLAIYQHLVHCLSLRRDLTVLVHLDAG